MRARCLAGAWLGSLVVAVLVASSPAAAAEEGREGIVARGARLLPVDAQVSAGAPGADAIAALDARARGRVMRLWSGDTVTLARHARFDPLGVTFAAGRRAGPWPWLDESGAARVPWAAIDRIESRHSYWVTGLITGAFIATIAGAALADHAGPDPGPGIAIVLAFPPAGALIGGAIGASIPRWRQEWPPAAASPVPAR